MSSKAARPWRRRIKMGALSLASVLGLMLVGGAGFAMVESSRYDSSTEKVYDIPPGKLVRSTDPAVIARGKHLTQSLAGCAISACHGADMSGGHVSSAGPIGTEIVPNASQILIAYTDGEIERLIRHGVKKDGRTVRFMIADEFNWLPDSDVVAIISYLRTVPPVDRTTGTTEIKTFGKVMDRMGYIPIDIARRIDHDHVEIGPEASATAEYGKWIARMCTGCHGAHMSGGPLPGTPPDFGVPRNLTPDPSGLAGWTYEDFVKMAETGQRRDGRPLAKFMPVEFIRNMDETERRAIWAYLQSLPPVPFGNH